MPSCSHPSSALIGSLSFEAVEAGKVILWDNNQGHTNLAHHVYAFTSTSRRHVLSFPSICAFTRGTGSRLDGTKGNPFHSQSECFAASLWYSPHECAHSRQKKKGPSETLGTSSHRLDTYAIRRSQHLRGEHIMARARGCARRSFAKGASMWSSLRNLHYTGRRATVRAWSGAYNNSKRTPVALRRKKST